MGYFAEPRRGRLDLSGVVVPGLRARSTVERRHHIKPPDRRFAAAKPSRVLVFIWTADMSPRRPLQSPDAAPR